MPFKIVNTIEKGKSVLTTVPDEWEKDGHLYWPRISSMKAEKLRRLEYSKPEEDWKITNCILKRQNLKSFDIAELEVEKMCPNSDTETDKEREKKTVKNKELPSAFDKIVNECLGSTSPCLPVRGVASNKQQDQNHQEPRVLTISQEPQAASLDEVPQEFSFQNITINEDLILGDTLATKIDTLMSKINAIETNQAVLQANINVVLENQKLCYEGQQLMMLNLSQTLTQFEEFMKRKTQNTEILDFQLINDHIQLRRLEHLLENAEQELELKRKLASVCGKGKGRGINNAYALVDIMFDRKFLKTCSWAGGSRSTESKVCFKSFTKVIKFFFDIVFESDNSFTLTECHVFFKNVLKNSSQRCKSKNLRTSTTKHRPKKKSNVDTTLAEVSTDGHQLSENTLPEEIQLIERNTVK